MDDVKLETVPGDLWSVHAGLSPIVGTAIHNGHHVRDPVRALFSITDADYLREEDPFTEYTIRDVPNRLIFHRSRFEVDLNRARGQAVYLTPEQSWGVDIWAKRPAPDLVEDSLSFHDDYYDMLKGFLTGLQRRYGTFLVLDIHSYNHRRNGPDGAASDPQGAPEINIGTFSMDRGRWAPLVDTLIACFSAFEFRGRRMDVRENIAFQGKGEQTRFIHQHFPQTGCAIAIEFKKFFMDEWTGEPDVEALTAMRTMIRTSLPRLEEALQALR
ncbi:N-formylglutamate amidohydrolase [Pararhizobium sp.]|uniref:N-formylglutamate amidohydrolase n=1 Tax=Pararhizobium sp. TaxID=1977563 RepID=UPI0027189204|nr:N-formylglutamate amidohydrolase [Pararhizobium sp.]MDO9415939.1 N-formylglutamate amidohydrolase [Pararhizobium sp.]